MKFRPWEKLHYAARYAGTVAILPFSLLWIPVSRGSPFLRLVGVSFERAVRYHMWLATLMMVFLTFHGLGYILYYVKTNQANEVRRSSLSTLQTFSFFLDILPNVVAHNCEFLSTQMMGSLLEICLETSFAYISIECLIDLAFDPRSMDGKPEGTPLRYWQV